MLSFKVKDESLAPKGELLIKWASIHMPVLREVSKRFEREKPLDGIKIGACLHVTKETAVLVEVLRVGGAEVILCAANPLSTQDEVAAALVMKGISVYAWRGESIEEYYWCINEVINKRPKITMDDGADLVTTIHKERPEALIGVKGGTEETTTGVLRLKAMEKAKALRYPIIAVNEAHSKYLFDNRYGTGQSTLDGIFRATNVLLAGKNFVVCGYGWCGKGVSMRAKGMGANVIVTEVNPIRALEAVMDGFRVMPMDEAAVIGDIFVTVTGNIDVIRAEHMEKMKDGAILANSGHFNVEINLSDLERLSKSKRNIRANLDEYVLHDGRRLYLLSEGRVVNLAAAEGHPPEVMDMSFANQALCVEHLAKKCDEMEPKVYVVPKEIDEEVARIKLKSMGVRIDELTERQKEYLIAWEVGTL